MEKNDKLVRNSYHNVENDHNGENNLQVLPIDSGVRDAGYTHTECYSHTR